MIVKPVRILIPIQQGHLSRLLLQSGVIARLVSLGAEVVILAKGGVESSLRSDLPAGVILDELPLHRYRLNTVWYRVFEYLFQTILPTSSARARESWIRQAQPFRYMLIRLGKMLGAAQLARLWITVRRILLPAHLTDELWKRHNPDLVIVGTLGKHIEEYHLLRGAQRHKTPSLCTMISWDKLTTREYVLERPDMMTVWNAFNRQEAIDLHGFEAEKVRVTGIPQFDIYAHSDRFPSRDEFFQMLGLDPARKLLFVTPQPGHVHRNLGQTIQALAHMLREEKLPFPCQVLIRPHPSVYADVIKGEGTESDLQLYESLHPHIHGNRPQISTTGVWADTKVSEVQVLAAALHHADVVIDFYGTVSIESCMLDTPVVYVDPHAMLATDSTNFKKPTGVNYAEYVHLQHAIRLGAGRVVYNEGELHRAICDFLTDPSLDAEKRREVVAKLCYANDGKSTDRLVSAILDAAQGRWS